MSEPDFITEPSRNVLVYRRCDVLVVGGGPAGCAAAVSAARMGAAVVLVERYGHLGGMSTGGFVLWIDRMTDWEGRQVVPGIANDILERIPDDDVLRPPPELWGSRDEDQVAYWQDRTNAFQGTATWSPTVDPEMLKLAYMDLTLESGVKLLLHSWGVATVMDGDEVQGLIFESKSGRQAILAGVTIDTTGDGDVFALAGAEFETNTHRDDPNPGNVEFAIAYNIHDRMNISVRWGSVDMERDREFKKGKPDAYQQVMSKGRAIGVTDRPFPMPRADLSLFMALKLSGQSPLNFDDLTTVEVEGRRRMMVMFDFYRRNMPGFENAWIVDTSPQVRVRHSRRLSGVKRMAREDWQEGVIHDDEIGVSPSPNRRFPNVSVPLNCLAPESPNDLMAAGRNLSSDPATHSFMREVPQCWLMGQAAEIAAASAASAGIRVRDVDVDAARLGLQNQGVVLTRSAQARSDEADSGTDSECTR